MALTKRIYTTTQKVFVYGSGTFAAFFLILLSLNYMGIQVEISGDQVCRESCVSYFNITLANYSLCFGSTFKGLTTEPNVSVVIYKADARYARGNPARWKPYNFSANTCLEKSKKYEFMIVGNKSPSQTVKWGLSLQGKDVDPYWFGIEYFIEGNKVYVNDSKAYISAEPYQITKDDYVVFNVTSKVYSGNVDVILGLNTTEVTPIRAELYSPEWKNKTSGYACDFSNSYFNYTTSPKHFWCYLNRTAASNGTGLELIYDRDFEWSNLAQKTAYWNKSYLEEYKDISGVWQTINYNYGGVNKWFYKQNIPIQANKSYQFRVYIEIEKEFKAAGKWGGYLPKPINTKYWFAIKPSSETLQEAINNEHLYALDPWVNSAGAIQNKNYLTDGLIRYYNFDENMTENVFGADNLTAYTGTQIFNTTNALIGKSFQSRPSNTIQTSIAGDWKFYGKNTTLSFWFRIQPGTREQYIFGQCIGAGTYRAYVGREYGELKFYIHTYYTGTAYTNPVPIYNNTWYQFVYVKNDTGGTVYINGSIIGTGNSPGFLNEDTTNFKIGSYCDGRTSDALNGQMDEIGLWNRTLNSSEITDLFNSGAGISYYSPGNTTCNFSGSVKDENNNAVASASVIIINQKDNNKLANFTSNSSGGWSYNDVVVGNYTVIAYDPINKSRDGDADPFIACP